MKDQVDALKANGIPAAFINSTLSPAEIDRTQTEARDGEAENFVCRSGEAREPRFSKFFVGAQDQPDCD